MFMPKQDPIPWWKRVWHRILRFFGFRRFTYTKIIIPRFNDKVIYLPDLRDCLSENSLKDMIADKHFTYAMKIGDGKANEKAVD